MLGQRSFSILFFYMNTDDSDNNYINTETYSKKYISGWD